MVSEPVKTETVKIEVPGSMVVDVRTIWEGTTLSTEATQSKECQEVRLETWQNFERRTDVLPAWHWALFSGGLALTGTGAGLLGYGSSLSEPREQGVLSSPSVEKDRDRGAMLSAIGAAALSVGALALISETADFALLESAREPKEQVVKPLVMHVPVPCEQGPAVGHTLRLTSIGSETAQAQRVNLTMDGQGKASIDLLDPVFDSFPLSDPFLVLSCSGCAGWNISLSPEAEGMLALQRGELDGLQRWIRSYKTMASPDLVAAVEEAIAREKVEQGGRMVTFKPGSHRLTRVATAHLDRVAEYLLARRSVQLRIAGHTDARGSAKANAKLSRKRAKSVKTYLVDLGVPADRLITAAYGELDPVESNASASGRQQNRRSQFTIIDD